MSDDKIAEIRAQHELGGARGMTDDLIASLRDLAAAKHDDLSVAAAADEIERQARHIEALQAKIDAEKSCACSYDAPGDVCVAHSPALAEARAENSRLRALIGEYFREPDTHPVERGE